MIKKIIRTTESLRIPEGVRLIDMKPGEVGIILSGTAGFIYTVFCGTRGDILFLEDGDVFYRDSERLKTSTLRVRLYPEGTTVTLTV